MRFLVLDQQPDSLSAAFAQDAQAMPQAQLGDGKTSWQLESPKLAALRRKLIENHPALKQVYGSPLYGIKTGLNEAFVVDRATRDDLIARDPRSAELLKPFLVGEDLKKWRVEPQDQWLIYIPKNTIAIEDYPAIRDHLAPFKAKLEKRAAKQAWFELQQAQAAYIEYFEKPKVFYPDMSQGPKFSLDNAGYYMGNTGYFVPRADPYLLGLLNSSLVWFHLRSVCDALRGGEWRLRLFSENVETIPVPAANSTQRERISDLARECQSAAETRRDLRHALAHRIPDLAPAGHGSKLNGKLQAWWRLDFAQFRAEIKKAFKQDIPLAERAEWERHLDAERAKVLALDARIARAEAQLDAEVYALFDLSESEIALLKSGLARPAA